MKNFIRVKYIGKGDMIISEYNGKRYCFRKREPISIIPVAVYNYIQQGNTIHTADVIPWPEIQPVIIPMEEKKAMLEAVEPKRRGRPKK